MSKKIVLVLMTLLLIGNVSAWSYSNEEKFDDSHAKVEINGMYPVCDGEFISNQCMGKFYVDVSYEGDRFYYGELYDDWDDAKATDYGYVGIEEHEDGRIYFEEGKVPRYIICAWDYDEGNDGSWAWAGKCGGYIGDSYFPLETVDCFSGFCSGSTKNSCIEGQIVNEGIVIGKCSVECKQDSDCKSYSIQGSTDFKTCDENNENVIIVSSEDTCENYKCSNSKVNEILESCVYGCENAECKSRPIYIYLIPVSFIALILLIIWMLRKKPKKKRYK